MHELGHHIDTNDHGETGMKALKGLRRNVLPKEEIAHDHAFRLNQRAADQHKESEDIARQICARALLSYYRNYIKLFPTADASAFGKNHPTNGNADKLAKKSRLDLIFFLLKDYDLIPNTDKSLILVPHSLQTLMSNPR